MNELAQILFDLWKYDIEVFSKAWLYYWLCVPAFCYLMFFMAKWMVITAPIWLPITIIIKAFKK